MQHVLESEDPAFVGCSDRTQDGSHAFGRVARWANHQTAAIGRVLGESAQLFAYALKG